MHLLLYKRYNSLPDHLNATPKCTVEHRCVWNHKSRTHTTDVSETNVHHLKCMKLLKSIFMNLQIQYVENRILKLYSWCKWAEKTFCINF